MTRMLFKPLRVKGFYQVSRLNIVMFQAKELPIVYDTVWNDTMVAYSHPAY
jgi:hypothetical protein